MMALQEMSDRLEIQELLNRYSHAVDDRDWDALDDIFTPDAQIDYTEVGGAKGSLTEIKTYLAHALDKFKSTQHLSATTKLDLDGDQAKARTILFNPMVIDHGGREHVFFVGVWYRDTLARTPKGWRITSRYEEKTYFHNFPSDFVPAAT